MENEFYNEDINENANIIPEIQPVKKKTNWFSVAIAVSGCVALLTALAILVLQGMKSEQKPEETTLSTQTQNDTTLPTFDLPTYYVSDEVAAEKADVVVAQVGDRTLTNSQLQILYCMQVEEFLQRYGTSYFDYTMPLSDQLISGQSGRSWQKYFIDMAVNMWQRYQIFAMYAETENYESINEFMDTLNQLYADLENMAIEDGFENADAMIQADMGVGCTVDDYIGYITLRNVAILYLNEQYVALVPDMNTLEEYFTENESTYKKNGITKDSGLAVDVRHILVQLDEPAADTYGKVTYTEEQWAQCLEKAEGLLNEWKSGEATEESFAELANKNSKDGGSNTNGGLYQQVQKGEMVETFDAWIFDESRISGDTGIVKTDFGYHIMYFVNSEEIWIAAAKEDYISEKIDEMIAAGEEKYPLSFNIDNVALTDIYSTTAE